MLLAALVAGGVALAAAANYYWWLRSRERVIVTDLRRVADDRAPGDDTLRSELAVFAQEFDTAKLDILTARRTRLVLRFASSDGEKFVAKIARADRAELFQGLMAEASVLSYLTAQDFDLAPRLRGMEVLPNRTVALIRSELPGQTLHARMKNEVIGGRWPT